MYYVGFSRATVHFSFQIVHWDELPIGRWPCRSVQVWWASYSMAPKQMGAKVSKSAASPTACGVHGTKTLAEGGHWGQTKESCRFFRVPKWRTSHFDPQAFILGRRRMGDFEKRASLRVSETILCWGWGGTWDGVVARCNSTRGLHRRTIILYFFQK